MMVIFASDKLHERIRTVRSYVFARGEAVQVQWKVTAFHAEPQNEIDWHLPI
jgi:hypothetical protein